MDAPASQLDAPASQCEACGDASWRFVRRIADYVFSLESADPQLRPVGAALYGGCNSGEEASIDSRFVLARCGSDLILSDEDGAEWCHCRELDDFFVDAEWALTDAAMGRVSKLLQVHGAAVAATDGTGVLLAGAHGAGKTSMAIALTRCGAALLTDEVALVRPSDLGLTPFRRDLILHSGSERLFPELAGRDDAHFKRRADCRYLTPLAVDPEPPKLPVHLGHIAFPRFSPDAATSIRSIGEAEVARRLLRESFNLEEFGERGPELIAGMVETCAAVEVEFGDAREAAAALMSEIAMESSRSRKSSDFIDPASNRR